MIAIKEIEDPITGPRQPIMKELQGITLGVSDCHNASLALGEKRIKKIYRNFRDHLGQEDISVLWIPLTYLL
jgi:hypothetical protein